MRKQFLVILSLLLIYSQLYPAFWELKPGARPASLAYAYTAVTENADAVFYNPARLTLLVKPELNGGYERLYYGLDQDSLHYQSFFFALPESELGAFGAGTSYFLGNFYRESIYFLSYGKSLAYDFSAGLTFKYLRKKIETAYSQDIALDPFFALNGSAVSNFTFDIGLNWQSKNWTLALAARNLTSPDLAYQDSVSDRLPISVSFAAARRITYLLPWRLTGEVEYTAHGINDAQDGFWYAAGIEAEIVRNQLTAAAGFNKNMLSGGLSYRGLIFGPVQAGLDYSLGLPFSLTDETLPVNLLSHRLGFTLAFGSRHQAPELNDSRWQQIIPERYSLSYIADNQNRNLIVWVKDHSGNISSTQAAVKADIRPPELEKLSFSYDSQIPEISFKGEGIDYCRFSDGESQSSWLPVELKNKLPFYQPDEVNYLHYDLKDKAGNEIQGSVLIAGNRLIDNAASSDLYPLLDRFELINPHTARPASSFISDSLYVLTTTNASPTHLEYVINNEKPVRVSYRDKFPVDISRLSSGAKHRIMIRLIQNGVYSNSLTRSFNIDNIRPSAQFKFQGGRNAKSKIYSSSTTEPEIYTSQSLDVVEWLMCPDTLKWQNYRWQNQKPARYKFLDKTVYPAELYLRVRDEAGNLSLWCRAQYFYDTRLPVFRNLSLDQQLAGDVYLLKELKIQPQIQTENAVRLEVLLNGNQLAAAEISDNRPHLPAGIIIPAGISEGELVFRLYNENTQTAVQTVKFRTDLKREASGGLTVRLFDLKNGQAEITSSADIGMSIIGDEQYKYLLVSDNQQFTNPEKIDYQNLLRYKLKGDDGLRYLFFKAVAGDGRESKPVSAVIKLDRTAPHGSFRITSINGTVTLSKVEILYDSLSDDISGFYLTENREEVPTHFSARWLTTAPKFYNFSSKNDGTKKVFLYLTDRAGNISEPVSQTVLLKKFQTEAEKDAGKRNSSLPVAELFLGDRISENQKVSGSDTVRITVKCDKEISAWHLSEQRISAGDIKDEEWQFSEPQEYVFKNKTGSSGQLYLTVLDQNGKTSEEAAADSIRINALEPSLLKIQCADSSTFENAVLPVTLNFNKQLDKNSADELKVICISSKSGLHQVDLQIRDKALVLIPAGNFSAGEKLSFWVYGYYKDETRRRYYLEKRWSVTLKAEILKPELRISAVDLENGEVRAEIDNLNAEITEYRLAAEAEFSQSSRKIYNGSLIYKLPEDLPDGEYNLRAEYITANAAGSILDARFVLDRQAPAVQLYIKGSRSSVNGQTSGTDILLDVRGDSDIREFLIEELK